MKSGLPLLFSLLISLFAGAQGKKPNVILFLVDDLGYTDLSFTGSNFYETPNLDALANQGVFFDNAYSANPVCSPCLLYTSPSPRDATLSRMPSSA